MVVQKMALGRLDVHAGKESVHLHQIQKSIPDGWKSKTKLSEDGMRDMLITLSKQKFLKHVTELKGKD